MSQRAASDPLRAVLDDAERLAAGTPYAEIARDVRTRLDAPLRVALAGRIKAGKSTLLNALVGERLAATDAGECTRIVTWYRHGLGYDVRAILSDGRTRELPFHRDAESLAVELDGLDASEVDRLDVAWPSRRLEAATLIDTPGLGSASVGVSARTESTLLGGRDARAGTRSPDIRASCDDDGGEAPAGATDDVPRLTQADAVVYLMPHVHGQDAAFLEAFTDRSLTHVSPVNAVAVLSRADEIGGGRPDALESAAQVAGRYADDPRLRRVAAAVLPVAGLLGETGATLREEEVAWLRTIADLDGATRGDLMLSVDRFRRDTNPLPPAARERLLGRFGLFGLRYAVAMLAGGRARGAVELSRALREASGVTALERTINDRFASQAGALKARSATAALRYLASRLVADGVPGAGWLLTDVERLEAASSDLARLRLLHLVLTDAIAFSEPERAEAERVAGADPAATRDGIEPDGDPAGTGPNLLAAIERWRARAADPLADRLTVEAAELMARSYEALFVAVQQRESGSGPRSSRSE